jgi:hypothetical protein
MMGGGSKHLLKNRRPVRTLKTYDQRKHHKEAFLDKTIAEHLIVFSHPDYTVGSGTSPDPPLRSNRSRALPPIGNWECQCVPSPCPEDILGYEIFLSLENTAQLRALSIYGIAK